MNCYPKNIFYKRSEQTKKLAKTMSIQEVFATPHSIFVENLIIKQMLIILYLLILLLNNKERK